MPLGNMPDFSFKHVDQPDRPTESASTRKQQWDSQAVELRTFLNSLIAKLNSTTDGNSGADNIAMTPISETGAAATAQAVIEALVARLKSATDGSSGADLVKATAIPGIDGASVQEVLESLRNKLKSTTDGTSGADFINATSIEGVSGATIQTILESLKSLTDSKETPAGAQSKVNTHANRTDNPHGVTALQAGAETPVGAQAKVDIHANNKNNPHEVTALQTGAITQIAGLSNPGGNIGIEGGTGIAVTTNPSTKKVILTATGTAVPGAHASAHGMYGTDPINPALIGAAGIGQVSVLESQMAEDQTATIPLAHGTQTLTAPRTSPAKVKIPGRTLVNLLGRDGNCEDVSKWAAGTGSRATIALNPNDKVFGNNSIKVTADTQTGAHYMRWRTLSLNTITPESLGLAAGDYIFMSAFAKPHKGQGRFGIECRDSASVGLAAGASTSATNPSEFTRIFCKHQIPESTAYLSFLFYANDIEGNNSYAGVDENVSFDGACLYKISAEDYALSDTELLAKYPYVDSVQHLTGAYVANETNDSYLYLMDSLGEGEVYENGQKNKVWESKVLGGSLPWEYSSSGTGFKNVKLVTLFPGNDPTSEIATKYDGKILRSVNGAYNSADCVNLESGGTLYLSIANTDSGWGPDYTPTSAEIAAYFMGWRMSGDDWSQPYTSGTKQWAKLYCGVGIASGGSSMAWVVGNSNTNSCPTTMNDQGYTPYELHYKLTTPITVPVETEGGLMLSAGENQLTLGEGVVVREVASPQVSGEYAMINNSLSVDSQLNYRAEKIIDIYKDGIIDNVNWPHYTANYTHGKDRVSALKSDFDPSATYSVTYLAEPYQISASTLYGEITYAENLGTVVQDVVESVSTVETDLSSFKAFQRLDMKLLREAISRPHMERNWDWRRPVNQRGITTLATTAWQYGLDMWKIGNSTISVKGGYVNIVSLKTAVYKRITQMFEPDEILRAGKTYTLSILARCNVISGTVILRPCDSTYGNVQGIQLQLKQSGFAFHSITFTPTVDFPGFGIEVLASNTVNDYFDIDVAAWKLEKGNFTTLPNDPPADYGEQLTLCQRYYYRLSGAFGIFGSGIALSSTLAPLLFSLPTKMRIIPTISFSGTLYLQTNGALAASGKPVTGFSSTVLTDEGIKSDATVASGLTAGNYCTIQLRDANSYIEFSADL